MAVASWGLGGTVASRREQKCPWTWRVTLWLSRQDLEESELSRSSKSTQDTSAIGPPTQHAPGGIPPHVYQSCGAEAFNTCCESAMARIHS
jgi:hypothetical protein